MLGGSVATTDAWPAGVTAKRVPDRSPTKSVPSSANARPQATPTSVTNGVAAPRADTLYTTPSNRLVTYRRPSGPKAMDVAFTIPLANGSRAPVAPTRKIDTG